jgi:hypothetical protein
LLIGNYRVENHSGVCLFIGSCACRNSFQHKQLIPSLQFPDC